MGVILRGAGIVLDSALTLALNITMTQGAFTAALSCSTTLAAGVYDIFSFAAKVNSALRTDIRTKALAASVDTVPAAASILFKIVFPVTWSATPNANILSCTFSATGFLEGGIQCALTVFTLNNTSGWASKLGLAPERTTTVTSTIVSPLGTVTGTHQPRSIYCFEASYQDTWDYEVRPAETTIVLRNGKVRRWSEATVEQYRDFTLVDLPPEITGYPLDVMTFSVFGADRSILTFHNPDESGLTNVSNIHLNRTPVVGDLIRIAADDFFSRVASVSATQILCAEAWPVSIVPTAGDTIEWISEAHALWIEAHRTGWYACYEQDVATGQPLFKATWYALRLDGRYELPFQRRDLHTLLFSVTYPLVRRVTPETVQI